MNKENWPRPLHDGVFVKVVEGQTGERMTAGGIVIPGTSRQQTLIGEVMDIGPGLWCNELGKYWGLPVKKGDMVHFGEFSGSEVKMPDGDVWLLMKFRDLLAAW